MSVADLLTLGSHITFSVTNSVFLEELIISMLTNQPLSEQSVRQALIGRGPVVSIKPTGPPISDGHTSTAWLVEFRYYADCKEAIKVIYRACLL